MMFLQGLPELSDWAKARMARDAPEVPVGILYNGLYCLERHSAPKLPEAGKGRDQLRELSKAAQALVVAINGLSIEASDEVFPDPLFPQILDPLLPSDRTAWEWVEQCRDLAVKASLASKVFDDKPASQGRRRGALSALVAVLAFYFEKLDLEVAARPDCAFFQVVNVVWGEVFGHDSAISEDALRKALARGHNARNKVEF